MQLRRIKSGAEFSVNGDQRIGAVKLTVIIAYESGFGPDLNVAMSSIPVNQDSPNRRVIRIADRQPFESVATHQFITRLSRVGSLGIRIDDARGKQRVFHIMPARGGGFSMGAFLRKRRGAREFWIETKIDFRKGMDDRLGPVMTNDADRGDSTHRILIDKFLGRFLEAFSAKGQTAGA